MESGLPITFCKRRLATVWFGGAGIVFLLVLLQSLFGRYGDEVTQAWGWLLSSVMPTLSLIIGVLVLDAVQRADVTRTIDAFLFRLTVWLSLAYLLAVFLVVVLTPFSDLGPIQLMTKLNVVLGPVQGLVAAAMGAFFVRAAREVHFTLEEEEEGPAIAAAAAAAESGRSRER